ncbi:hypothetical protein BB561_006490 [Smittium simulii]|uniref:AB hydrolase-1 domain-containing protein n=1 Tax=Smittium simulii TaxID=133385 RepID=A0A2T9Y3T6_9FUNG|nr:hypothetical protein BB561_006490 [Smittium simulii]
METVTTELNINREYLNSSGHILVGSTAKTHCKLFYEIYGEGPKKIAFLNGMGTDRQMWELLVQYFAPKKDYQILVYDHRGTGYSEDCAMLSITTLQMAKDANDVLEFLKWDKEINIVGISMGGMIAQELGLLVPGKIKTITLCSTTSGWTLYKKSAVIMNIRMLMTKVQEEQIDLVLNILYPKGFRRKLKNTRIHGMSSIVGQTLAVLRHRVSDKSLNILGELFPSRRIWIVVGTWDNFIPENDSHCLAKQIGNDSSVLDVFEGAGHSIPTQNFDQFVKKLQLIVDAGQVPLTTSD